MESNFQTLGHKSQTKTNNTKKTALEAPKTQKPNSSLWLDKIGFGDGFGFLGGKSEVEKAKLKTMDGKITADDYGALLLKCFSSFEGSFEKYDPQQGSSSHRYPTRVVVDEFEALNKNQNDFRKFRAFVSGERSVFSNGSQINQKLEVNEVNQVNSTSKKIVLTLSQKVLEQMKKFLILKFENGALFSLFQQIFQRKIFFGGDYQMGQKVEEDKEVLVCEIENGALVSSYFASQYEKNKPSLGDGYPTLEGVGEALKEMFEPLVKEWEEKEFEAFGLTPGCLILNFSAKTASFTFKINNEVLEQASEDKDDQKSRKISQKNLNFEDERPEPPLNLNQADEAPPLKGAGQQRCHRQKQQEKIPSVMRDYELFKKRHPFRGPPKNEWFIFKPFDLYEAKKRKFTTKLFKASYTTQKYELFNRYNAEIHGKTEPMPHRSFKKNICSNEIHEETLVSTEDPSKKLELGSYHLELYLDGTLIGVDYIKIIKSGIVGCYFFYEPSLRPLNLGSVVIFEKLEFIQQTNQYFKSFKYLFLNSSPQNNPKLK